MNQNKGYIYTLVGAKSKQSYGQFVSDMLYKNMTGELLFCNGLGLFFVEHQENNILYVNEDEN